MGMAYSKPKKWGFDVDGVLANFTQAYHKRIIEVTGKDLFTPDEVTNPKSWDWDLDAGYTVSESKRTWAAILADAENFWSSLNTLPGMEALLNQALNADKDHVYFITARAGSPKRITELWLEDAGWSNPTVLMAKSKGHAAKALNLDVYIDDNLPNAMDVAVESPETRNYLLNYRHNAGDVGGVIRINTVQDMFDMEDDQFDNSLIVQP